MPRSDQSGEEKRNQVAPSKDFLNQAQIFRTIGGFLDKNEAKLIRLANNQAAAKDATLVVEYINRDREHVVDDRAGSSIYDLCVGMYKQRGKLTGTGGARGACAAKDSHRNHDRMAHQPRYD